MKSSIRGLGDVVHAVLKPAVKIMDTTLKTKLGECGGCKKRREALNKAVPLK